MWLVVFGLARSVISDGCPAGHPEVGAARRRLKQDLQSQFWGTAALEEAGRGVQVNVVPHCKPSCLSWMEPCTLELFRPPPFDPLDLRLIDYVDVSRRHAVLSPLVPMFGQTTKTDTP